MTSRRYRALLAGNADFPKDPSNLPSLKYAATDIAAMHTAITDSRCGLFLPDAVKVYFNKTTQELSEAVEELFTEANRDDVVLFYYSGHGRHEINQDLYLCAHNTRTDRLRSTALPASLISGAITESKAAATIIILDCCHSGAFKGGSLSSPLSGRGRSVLASSHESQLSLAGTAEDQPSPFTSAIADGLLNAPSQTNLTVGRLYEYARHQVVNGPSGQIPQQRIDGDELIIARRGHSPRPVPQSQLPAPASGSMQPWATGLRRQALDLEIADRREKAEAEVAALLESARQETERMLSVARVEARKITDVARGEAGSLKEEADALRARAEREVSELHTVARREREKLRSEAERESKQLRISAVHEVAELKASVEREVATLRATVDREVTQVRAKAGREAQEKRAEAAGLFAEAKERRDKDLQALDLELAERKERAEREESERHTRAVVVTQSLVAEAEGRARDAVERTKAAETRAVEIRSEADRYVEDTMAKAEKDASRLISDAKVETNRLYTDAKSDAERFAKNAQEAVINARQSLEYLKSECNYLQSMVSNAVTRLEGIDLGGSDGEHQ
jgi:hypothetical protein